jgi:hypothetical protein
MRIIKSSGFNIIKESEILKEDLDYFNFLYNYNFELYIKYSDIMKQSTFSKSFKNFIFYISLDANIYNIYIRYKQTYKVKLQRFTMRDITEHCLTLKDVNITFKNYANNQIRKMKLKSII